MKLLTLDNTQRTASLRCCRCLPHESLGLVVLQQQSLVLSVCLLPCCSLQLMLTVKEKEEEGEERKQEEEKDEEGKEGEEEEREEEIRC